MKMKKIFAGMTAAALSLTMVMSASAATYLFDKVHPDDNDKEMNDSYYKIGAMGYFMSQKWTWNEYDWVGIDADGVIDISITVDEAKADTTLSGKGTLGDVGVMICNLPEDGYPYNVDITDAKYTCEDGTVIEFPKLEAQTILKADSKESGCRIHIRPTTELDDDGNPYPGRIARPEVAGWDQEGNFKPGTLSMKINLNVESIDEEIDGDDEYVPEDAAAEDTAAEDTAAEDTSAEDTTAEDTAADDTAEATTTTTTTTGTTNTTTNTTTGAASNAILAAMAMAAAGVVASKKRK